MNKVIFKVFFLTQNDNYKKLFLIRFEKQSIYN